MPSVSSAPNSWPREVAAAALRHLARRRARGPPPAIGAGARRLASTRPQPSGRSAGEALRLAPIRCGGPRATPNGSSARNSVGGAVGRAGRRASGARKDLGELPERRAGCRGGACGRWRSRASGSGGRRRCRRSPGRRCAGARRPWARRPRVTELEPFSTVRCQVGDVGVGELPLEDGGAAQAVVGVDLAADRVEQQRDASRGRAWRGPRARR